jgi:dynein heavy chain 1
MLKRVEPLRNELLALESQANENKLKGDDVMKLIADLERSIAKYKEEYALLISQAQAIKTDLNAVELKVFHFEIIVKNRPFNFCTQNSLS